MQRPQHGRNPTRRPEQSPMWRRNGPAPRVSCDSLTMDAEDPDGRDGSGRRRLSRGHSGCSGVPAPSPQHGHLAASQSQLSSLPPVISPSNNARCPDLAHHRPCSDAAQCCRTHDPALLRLHVQQCRSPGGATLMSHRRHERVRTRLSPHAQVLDEMSTDHSFLIFHRFMASTSAGCRPLGHSLEVRNNADNSKHCLLFLIFTGHSFDVSQWQSENLEIKCVLMCINCNFDVAFAFTSLAQVSTKL